MEPVPTRERYCTAALGCLEAYTAVIGLNVHGWQPIERMSPRGPTAEHSALSPDLGPGPARETRIRVTEW